MDLAALGDDAQAVVFGLSASVPGSRIGVRWPEIDETGSNDKPLSPMTPDLPTLFGVAGLINFIHTITLGVLWRTNPGIKGISFWAMCSLLSALGLPLLMIRMVVEDKAVGILLPNLFNMTAMGCLYVGVCRFLEQPIRKKTFVAVGVLFSLPFLYFLYFDDNIKVRITLASLAGASLSILTIRALLAENRPTMRVYARIVTTALTVYAVAHLYRSISIYSPGISDSMLDPDLFHQLSGAGSVVASILWSFCAFLMINCKQTINAVASLEEQRQIERELQRARLLAADQTALRQREMLLRDLHDGIGGINATIAVMAMVANGEEDQEAMKHSLSSIEKMAREGSDEIRLIMNRLDRPEFPWSIWLASFHSHAANALNGRIDMQWEAEIPPAEPIQDNPAAVSLLRALKEAVNNLARHSHATRASIAVRFRDSRLRILISDNGTGLPEGARGKGRGLNNMKKRCTELGGTFEIHEGKGPIRGLTLDFSIPIPLKYDYRSFEFPTENSLNLIS